MSKVIITYGRKGGVGKTNLAWALYCKYTKNLKVPSRVVFYNTDKSSNSIYGISSVLAKKLPKKLTDKLDVRSTSYLEAIYTIKAEIRMGSTKTYIIDMQGTFYSKEILEEVNQICGKVFWICPLTPCKEAYDACIKSIDEILSVNTNAQNIFGVINLTKKIMSENIMDLYDEYIKVNKLNHPKDEYGENLVCEHCSSLSDDKSTILSLASGLTSGKAITSLAEQIKNS